MERFKVGDRVVCIKEQPYSYLEVGERGVIKGLGDIFHYVVDFGHGNDYPMDEEELAHDKEYQVLTILRNYKNEKETSNL